MRDLFIYNTPLNRFLNTWIRYLKEFDTIPWCSPSYPSCSRDEVKSKWSVSDFIKAFIKFHGHVYLSKSPDKLSTLREKLEEQFQVPSVLVYSRNVRAASIKV